MDVLTKQQCEKTLDKLCNSNIVSLKSFSVQPLSELNGLITKQYTLKLKYEREGNESEAEFFLKSLDDCNPTMFKLVQEMQAYEKESFFYMKLIPLMESCGLNCDFAPKCYFSEPLVVILEDLSILSYKGFAKNKSLDANQCKKCLETLARFHVTPILYELEKSKVLGRDYRLIEDFNDILQDVETISSGVVKYINCSALGICELVDLIPSNGIGKAEFKSKLLEMMKSSNKIHSSKYRSTVLHNDLWCSNFLFRFDNVDTVTSSKLIDFQTISYGSLGSDVMLFLFTNTTKHFRDLQMEELLSHYYNYFSKLLEERGYCPGKILPEDEFRDSCNTFRFDAKLFAVVDRCVTATSDEDYLEVLNSEEGFSKFLFEDRGKFILKSFKENTEFREMITGEISELRSMLFDV